MALLSIVTDEAVDRRRAHAHAPVLVLALLLAAVAITCIGSLGPLDPATTIYP